MYSVGTRDSGKQIGWPSVSQPSRRMITLSTRTIWVMTLLWRKITLLWLTNATSWFSACCTRSRCYKYRCSVMVWSDINNLKCNTCWLIQIESMIFRRYRGGLVAWGTGSVVITNVWIYFSPLVSIRSNMGTLRSWESNEKQTRRPSLRGAGSSETWKRSENSPQVLLLSFFMAIFRASLSRAWPAPAWFIKKGTDRPKGQQGLFIYLIRHHFRYRDLLLKSPAM